MPCSVLAPLIFSSRTGLLRLPFFFFQRLGRLFPAAESSAQGILPLLSLSSLLLPQCRAVFPQRFYQQSRKHLIFLFCILEPRCLLCNGSGFRAQFLQRLTNQACLCRSLRLLICRPLSHPARTLQTPAPLRALPFLQIFFSQGIPNPFCLIQGKAFFFTYKFSTILRNSASSILNLLLPVLFSFSRSTSRSQISSNASLSLCSSQACLDLLFAQPAMSL